MCLAYQVDEATYRTAHTSEECNCDFVGVKTEDLVEKLAADQVPLVTITDESQLQVVSGGEYSYISFSLVVRDSTIMSAKVCCIVGSTIEELDDEP